MGAAGLGTSVVLSNEEEEHLILEGKEKIGGRIKSFTFGGRREDEGAAYLHYPYDGNIFHRWAEKLGIKQLEANEFIEHVYFKQNRLASTRQLFSASQVY